MSTVKKPRKFCINCGKLLTAEINERRNSDGFCNQRCKRKDKQFYLKASRKLFREGSDWF
jgi:endogenous inhibitor of DNA gyrase (YacG/DUF329 family)